MRQAALHDGLRAVASYQAGLSIWAHRPIRRPAGRRLDGGAGTGSPDVDALGAVPLVPSGAIGPTSVQPRPAGRAGGLARLITRSFPRVAAIISFCTTWATIFRLKVGGSLSPQSWCTMSKYRVLPTMKTFSIAPIV